jgi:hypothetical protein
MRTSVPLFVSLLALTEANPVPLSAKDSLFDKRDILRPLPEAEDSIEITLQPLLDFDKDGCYNTAAIDPDGNTNPGKQATGTPEGQCRDKVQLENSNTYSRKRCNNGYCAVMYEYYFEKDQAALGSYGTGHRHDWENIVVFSKGNDVVRVAPSCHADYKGASNSFPRNDKHPLLVYHKDGAGTHCFRIASDNDVQNPENAFGGFYRSPLVGWDHWPSVSLRQKMLDAWSGGIGPKLDTEFGDSLKKAAGDGVPGFDPYTDSFA